ncbi:MAG: DNA primase, partial [Novosphingobium sp.]|nr:DNA primase [Novosphingobium sp.]
GHEFKACCPFHNEKTPSFTVNDDKGFYHCFGCGAHGDVIRWMTDQRGLAFMDAVRELAAEAGMELPALEPRDARQAEQRSSLQDVMAAAQAWFAGNLAAPEGAAARAYLATRGFDAHTVERFGFGFAPEDRQALKKALAGFDEAQLIEAGLRIQIDGKEPYDRFRGRLMLPIEDARGRVIAFGGRILDGAATDAPKYLNSPDTPLFDKGRTLYNLHRAGPLARRSRRLIVVEGYMDVIALAAHGIGEAVAPLGTALTEHQLQLLWRVVETPVLCFDGDAAGQRAAFRAVGRALPLLRPAHSLSIVRLPAGLDPDDLVRREGAAGFEALLGQACSLIDTLWEHEREALPLVTPEDKAGLKARLLGHMETIADPDIRALYRRELLERFSAFAFPRRDFTREFKRDFSRGGAAKAMPLPRVSERLRRTAPGAARDAFTAAIVAGLLRWPAEIARHAETLAPLATHDPRIDVLLDVLDSGEPVESVDLAPIFAARGVAAPAPEDYAGLPFGFLAADAQPEQATAELAQAVALLVERPALEAALANATAQFERELSDGAYAEQQRLLKRKLEFDARLRLMASARGAPPPGPGADGDITKTMAD